LVKETLPPEPWPFKESRGDAWPGQGSDGRIQRQGRLAGYLPILIFCRPKTDDCESRGHHMIM
jgi:hypothetical protein